MNIVITPNNIIDVLSKNKLFSKEDALLITGSLGIALIAFHCMYDFNFDKYNNGQSDVDVFIILKHGNNLPKQISMAERELFLNRTIHMINYSFRYGVGRNCINIKYILKNDFINRLLTDTITYQSWRKIPLTKFKKNEMFYCSDGSKYTMPYHEYKCNDSEGYILLFFLHSCKDNKYIFSNIHSMIFNGLLFDPQCLVSSEIDTFKKKLFNFFCKLDNRGLSYIFGYFIDRKLVESKDLKKIVSLLANHYNYSKNEGYYEK